MQLFPDLPPLTGTRRTLETAAPLSGLDASLPSFEAFMVGEAIPLRPVMPETAAAADSAQGGERAEIAADTAVDQDRDGGEEADPPADILIAVSLPATSDWCSPIAAPEPAVGHETLAEAAAAPRERPLPGAEGGGDAGSFDELSDRTASVPRTEESSAWLQVRASPNTVDTAPAGQRGAFLSLDLPLGTGAPPLHETVAKQKESQAEGDVGAIEPGNGAMSIGHVLSGTPMSEAEPGAGRSDVKPAHALRPMLPTQATPQEGPPRALFIPAPPERAPGTEAVTTEGGTGDNSHRPLSDPPPQAGMPMTSGSRVHALLGDGGFAPVSHDAPEIALPGRIEPPLSDGGEAITRAAVMTITAPLPRNPAEGIATAAAPAMPPPAILRAQAEDAAPHDDKNGRGHASPAASIPPKMRPLPFGPATITLMLAGAEGREGSAVPPRAAASPEGADNSPIPVLHTAGAMPLRSEFSDPLADQGTPLVDPVPLTGTEAGPLSPPAPGAVTGAIGEPGGRASAPGLPPSMAAQLSAAMSKSLRRTTEVELTPVELGRVRIAVRDDTSRTLILTVDRPETLALMQRHLDQLIRELRHEGVDAPRVMLERGDQGGSNDARGQQQDFGGQSGARDGPRRAQPRDDPELRSGAPPPQRPVRVGGVDIRL